MFHLSIDHFVHAMHCDAAVLQFSHCTVNALHKYHVHVHGWNVELNSSRNELVHATFFVPNAQMNCIAGVIYVWNSVSNDVFEPHGAVYGRYSCSHFPTYSPINRANISIENPKIEIKFNYSLNLDDIIIWPHRITYSL